MAPEANHTKRTALAVIFGALAGAMLGIFIVTVLMAALWAVRYGELFPAIGGLWSIPIVGLIAGGLFGIPAMLIAGLPAHALLYNRGLHSAWTYVIAGALAGLPTALVAGQLDMLFLVNSDLPPDEEPLNQIMSAVSIFPQAAILGASCAFCFWLIRRPDRDAASKLA